MSWYIWPLSRSYRRLQRATAGFRLTSHLESDFLLQIKGTITTLWAENANGQFDLWNSVGAVVILFGVLLCLVYFFFSREVYVIVSGRSSFLLLIG